MSIMLFGTLGYAFGGRDEENNNKIEYKGIEFVQDNSGYWSFIFQNYQFTTKYNPQETEDIDFFTTTSINNYINQPLYFISNFNEPNFEISRNLNQFVLRMQNACLDEEDCEADMPVKNCSEDNIIIIQEPEDSENKIYEQEKCVFIVADFENQTKYTDVFLFKILGI